MLPKLTAAERQDEANRVAILQHALIVLGHAIIQPSPPDRYVLHNLTGGITVVRVKDGELVCSADNSNADLHTSIIALYRARMEGR